jgi:hypothetical protein
MLLVNKRSLVIRRTYLVNTISPQVRFAEFIPYSLIEFDTCAFRDCFESTVEIEKERLAN